MLWKMPIFVFTQDQSFIFFLKKSFQLNRPIFSIPPPFRDFKLFNEPLSTIVLSGLRGALNQAPLLSLYQLNRRDLTKDGVRGSQERKTRSLRVIRRQALQLLRLTLFSTTLNICITHPSGSSCKVVTLNCRGWCTTTPFA